MSIATHYVYLFGTPAPPPRLDKNLLGGKGKGLAEMAAIGLPVPPGFVISTEACQDFRAHGNHLPAGLQEEVFEGLKIVGETLKASFGSDSHPLLVSVRSGARVSMPGMMDTILDLGLNDRSVEAFAKLMHNERLAYDSFRRFIMMYAEIVQGVSRKYFEQAFHVLKMQEGVEEDTLLSIEGLKQACQIFKTLFQDHTGHPFPQDPYKQLFDAIAAVFKSWDGERAILYRQLNHIPDEWGTAVIVQSMVFGNRNENSATGVAFTRDPATGDAQLYGEFLLNAQGEEVVAGIRTPHPLNCHQKEISHHALPSLEELMPETYRQLDEIVHRLEKHYRDMQDIEFTIDDGRLFMLQTRSGKRTGFAAVRMAIEMLHEGLIDEKEALQRVQPDQLTQLLAPIFDSVAKKAAQKDFAAIGLNAGPGAASGQAAFSSQKAVEWQKQGIRSILVREEANPDDFPGMVAADGILTTRGGSTSHAAVVARGMGKPCIVGCSDLICNETAKTLSLQGKVLKEGDALSIDGTTGEVFFAELPTSPSEILQVLVTQTKKPEESRLYQNYQILMDLADKYRTLEVRTNADNPQDSLVARAFGAQGIGLCRTEHMFIDPKRLHDVRLMFFSTSEEDRKTAIDRLLIHQKNDFIAMFKTMAGLPVTIRLLDPPLHEFLPHNEEEMLALARSLHVGPAKIREIRASFVEQNPMLGLRGCRLGMLYPDLTRMQTRAIIEAAFAVEEEGYDVHPEIMVPLISSENELIQQKGLIDATAEAIFAEKGGMRIHYQIGTMIELPRAALTADAIAREAEFFSFGTNDLTQTTYGISRDDSAKFVPFYVKGVPDPQHPGETLHLYPEDPFQILDHDGVGLLMKLALEKGRKTRPDLLCGICGEHGGEPSSIMFCHDLGLDYVSCSPYRVPIARLAAAIATL